MLEAFGMAVKGKLIVVLMITLFDVFFGVILALRRGEFQWKKLAGYLDSDILPILVWLAIEALAFVPGDLLPVGVQLIAPQVVYGTVFLTIFASVAGHFSAIVPGITGALQRVGVQPTGYKSSDLPGNANRG